jgi:Rps23 Pro-64 3,4-dihydroxylase Tpa1-like proline 4-hydroxylase
MYKEHKMKLSPNELPLGVFDDPRYAKLAVENSGRYKNAEAYPHIYFDNFFKAPIAQRIAEEFPNPDDMEWVVRDNQYTDKIYQHDETKLTPYVRLLLREFSSRQFILFLETLTGIDNLFPDPYYIGGGVHIGRRGGFLKIHADFNWHHKLQAHRRVNILYYPNPGWKEEWGGDLQFWDKEMTRAVDRCFPFDNRLAVFTVGEDSNHGHPEPLKCPENILRRSINLYYYTTRRDESEIHQPHFTLYKTEASPFSKELGDNYRKSSEKVED